MSPKDVVTVCGPPPDCTCPAVAWVCICAASIRRRPPQAAAKRPASTVARDEEASR